MDDLIQLAAYAVIFIIIAGASIIKKIAEAQKQRAEMQRRKTGLGQHSPAPEQTTAPSKQPEEEEKPQFNLEDILRKALSIPEQEQPGKTVFRQTARPIIREMTANSGPETTVVYSKSAKLDDSNVESASQKVISDSRQTFSWQGLMSSLDEKMLSDAQKAIVLTELFNKPVVFRQSRNRVR
ncbi:MAG: hypothetical protein WC980_07925 [Candidatus Brocadiia bacterium]